MYLIIFLKEPMKKTQKYLANEGTVFTNAVSLI